jgi:aconitase A
VDSLQTRDAVRRWDPAAGRRDEVDLHPTRVFLHDTNGVPALVDLAAMRDAFAELGGDPRAVNPVIPAELVTDHSAIADVFGRPDARERNVELEYERNGERRRDLRRRPLLAGPRRPGREHVRLGCGLHLRAPPAPPGRPAGPAAPVPDIAGARVLVKLGDSITTDHISPAGAIPRDSEAGRYLAGLGVPPGQLNTFASRRGNHEVMARGAFANVRLRNQLVPGTVGGVTRCFDADGAAMPIYQAARIYQAHGTGSWSSPARTTAPGPPATGRPRAPGCSASGPSWASRSNASTAPTSSAWASCPSSSSPASRPGRSA